MFKLYIFAVCVDCVDSFLYIHMAPLVCMFVVYTFLVYIVYVSLYLNIFVYVLFQSLPFWNTRLHGVDQYRYTMTTLVRHSMYQILFRFMCMYIVEYYR